MSSFADHPDSPAPDDDPDERDASDDDVLHAFVAGHADPRTKRAALWALAVVVAVLVVTVLLVGLVDAGPGTPRTPQEAARRWFSEAAAGHAPTPSSLCNGIASADVPSRARVTGVVVRQTGTNTWLVTLQTDESRAVALSVERHRNRYVVC